MRKMTEMKKQTDEMMMAFLLVLVALLISTSGFSSTVGVDGPSELSPLNTGSPAAWYVYVLGVKRPFCCRRLRTDLNIGRGMLLKSYLKSQKKK
jgi:hypothetical protein